MARCNPITGGSAATLVTGTLLGVVIGATLSSLLSLSLYPHQQLAQLQQVQQLQQLQQVQQKQQQQSGNILVEDGEKGESAAVGKGPVGVPEAVPIETSLAGARQVNLWVADAARQDNETQDTAPKSLTESGDVTTSSSSSSVDKDSSDGKSSSQPDAAQCGPDALRPLVWGQNGEWSYASCNLCGMSAGNVADMLAQSHNCQTQVWDGSNWRSPMGFTMLNRSEEPVCVVTCSSIIPCRGYQSNGSLSAQQAGEQAQPRAPNGGPACLLAVWVRPGTSDAKVLEQVFLGLYGNGMAQLGVPPPDELPISSILDAGANIGLASVYFAMLYPGARIVSLEPSSSNFNVLLRNTARFPNVTALERGLWSRSTRLFLTQSTTSVLLPEYGYQVFENRSQIPKTSKIIGELQSVSVDFLLKSLALPKFNLIKIDIEGAEAEVFRKGVNTDFLLQSSVAILETHDRKRPGAHKIVLAAVRRYPRWSMTHESGEHICFIAR